VADIPPHERYMLKRKIKELFAHAGFTPNEQEQRGEFARDLLTAGVSRSVAAQRLMTRFGISRASAYSTLQQALTVQIRRQKLDEMA
jgi:hypothetical protein